MNPILIEPTDHSPRVFFHPKGTLLLEGRSLPEDAASFYNPLIDFCSKIKNDNVIIDVNLDYFNTASSKVLLDLLKTLDANSKIGNINVNWHYEEGDDDSVEMGEIYEEECIMRTRFQYFEHAEHVNLIDRTKANVT